MLQRIQNCLSMRIHQENLIIKTLGINELAQGNTGMKPRIEL